MIIGTLWKMIVDAIIKSLPSLRIRLLIDIAFTKNDKSIQCDQKKKIADE